MSAQCQTIPIHYSGKRSSVYVSRPHVPSLGPCNLCLLGPPHHGTSWAALTHDIICGLARKSPPACVGACGVIQAAMRASLGHVRASKEREGWRGARGGRGRLLESCNLHT